METLQKIEKAEAPAFALKPVRHGLRAVAMMLHGENRRDFNQLCNDLESEWRPRTPAEHFWVEQMAVSQWKLQRMQVVEWEALDKKPDTLSQIPLRERSYARAQQDLQRLQKDRPHPAPRPSDPVVFANPQPPPSAPVIDTRGRRSVASPSKRSGALGARSAAIDTLLVLL